jgi:hypothetical protein
VALVSLIVLIQFVILVTCFVNYGNAEDVAKDLWHNKFSVEDKKKFQNTHQCFGYSKIIDISATRYRVSCQASFEAVLSLRFLVIAIILLFVIAFQLANMSIGFYLAQQFPANSARKQELEILRKNYLASR